MEYYGKTLADAIHKATRRKQYGLQKKERFGAYPKLPYVWTPEITIFTQFGVTGSDADQHVTTVEVSFTYIGHTQSVFEVEITGGDEVVNVLGPDSVRVTITGNVATSLHLRCRTYSAPLSIAIDVISSYAY